MFITLAKDVPESKVTFDEKSFRWELNQDSETNEKLSEGIRIFAKDTAELKNRLEKIMSDHYMVI